MTRAATDTGPVWAAVDDQRRALCAELDGLTEEEWRLPSLCAGWTVRDVAAHLTLQQVGLLEGLGMVARSPGGMDSVIRAAARRRAALPTGELVERVRATVGSRRRNVGLTCRETLIDAVVHGQDVTVPLGRPLPVPAEAARLALERVWQRGRLWPFRARRRSAGLRLVATDTGWTAGDGPEVTGPTLALLLVLTGRPAGLPALSGEGVAALRARTGQAAVVPHDRAPSRGRPAGGSTTRGAPR
jgi:uncharacterized protein (TIGR03083 family)